MIKPKNYSEWKILYTWKTLQMGYLTIPLLVKLFNNRSLNICIINFAKNIIDYANEHPKFILHI